MKLKICILYFLLCIGLSVSGCAGEDHTTQDQDSKISILVPEWVEQSIQKRQALLDNIREQVQDEYFYNMWERLDPFADQSAQLCVPDAETALDLGNVLLTQFQKRGFFTGAIPQQIAYQEDPSIWIISCWNESAPDGPRAAVSFAIREGNAQVVKIWLCEAAAANAGKDAQGSFFQLTDEKRELIINSVRFLSESEKNSWEQVEERCIFTEPCVPDAETALLYGNALLRRFQRAGYYPRYLPQLIYYQTEPLVWVISCWEDLEPYTISACVDFAICGADAQVIGHWVGE